MKNLNIKILSYKFTYFKNNLSVGAATVVYIYDNKQFERTFIRDINNNITTKEYLLPYHVNTINL